jgi:AraC family transcriptional regulator
MCPGFFVSFSFRPRPRGAYHDALKAGGSEDAVRTYQQVYPSQPLLRSSDMARPSAADLLSLEYFEAEPGEMVEDLFDQHHVLLNLKASPQRVINWRDGVERDFMFEKDEIVVTPSGLRSGWRWFEPSQCIVITLDPAKLERFAQSEVGVVLTGQQLKDLPQFKDPDICQAGVMLRDALTDGGIGAAVMFESLARIFLVKLIQTYAERSDEEIRFSARFTARHFKRVLDHVAAHYGEPLTLEALTEQAGLSPSHFSRLFKATIGKSPMQFVTSYRVDQARKQLADPARPLSEIALDCGFSDQAHFSRVFRRSEGVTPSAYRQALSD